MDPVPAPTTAPTTVVSTTVPPVSSPAAAAGFIDVRTAVPDAIIDLRYATPNNFVHTPMYPPAARCLVHESLADGLRRAAERLREQHEVLVFWDCYRPHEVQVRMYEAFPDPRFVAPPGDVARSHETGRSVDVTIAGVDMGTDYDDFSERAAAFATEGVSAEAQANRARLRDAMTAGGILPYAGEWWHFDGPDAQVGLPILDVPVE